MSDTQTAVIRTTVNSFVMGVIAWAAANISTINVDLNDPFIIAVIGVLSGVVYTISLWAVGRWPVLGRLLFGVGSKPSYGPDE